MFFCPLTVHKFGSIRIFVFVSAHTQKNDQAKNKQTNNQTVICITSNQYELAVTTIMQYEILIKIIFQFTIILLFSFVSAVDVCHSAFLTSLCYYSFHFNFYWIQLTVSNRWRKCCFFFTFTRTHCLFFVHSISHKWIRNHSNTPTKYSLTTVTVEALRGIVEMVI